MAEYERSWMIFTVKKNEKVDPLVSVTLMSSNTPVGDRGPTFWSREAVDAFIVELQEARDKAFSS